MGNVTANYVKSINDIVVNSIIQSLQSSTNNYVQDQNITITCDEDTLKDIATAELRCWQIVLPGLFSRQFSASEISRICKPITCIGNSDISVSGAIFAKTITNMSQTTKTDISNTIDNNITSFAKQENHGFKPGFGDVTKNNVKNINEQVINVLTTTVQQSINEVEVIQEINISNQPINNVSQSSVQKLIMNKLLENSAYVSAVNQTASDLTAQVSSTSGDAIKNTFITIAKVVVILIILGILVWIVKKYQKRKKKRE